MRFFRRLVLAAVCVGGWVVAGSLVYVVRTPGRVVVLTKNRPALAETYVDTRGWTVEEAGRHLAIVERLIATGKVDRLKHVGTAAQLIDAAARGRQRG